MPLKTGKERQMYLKAQSSNTAWGDQRLNVKGSEVSIIAKVLEAELEAIVELAPF